MTFVDPQVDIFPVDPKDLREQLEKWSHFPVDPTRTFVSDSKSGHISR